MAAKRLIAITTEGDCPCEADVIGMMLCEGIDLVHVRKPSWDEAMVRSLLSAIDLQWHSRLVLHSHFSLAVEFSLYGVHLNSRAPRAPEGYAGSVSCSCHSMDELRERGPQMSYCTLSPIFDSISKRGYMSGFAEEELARGRRDNIITDRTMALGGVDGDNIDRLWQWGFGGACLLGYLWGESDMSVIRRRVRHLHEKAHCL